MRQPRLVVFIPSLVRVFSLAHGAQTRIDAGPRDRAVTAQLGQVNFPTSCAAEAQPHIEMGVALLHSFQYEQADQSFSEAAKRDSKCALAHWGKAMARYEQIWGFPSENALKLGAQDIQRSQKLGASTERERGYIAAASTFYLADGEVRERQSRPGSYAELR